MNIAALMGGGSTGPSPAVKAKHIAEAADSIAVAEKALQTSVFQWKPDYVSAAPMYERASGCYFKAEDYENARKMMVKCADCHDSSGAYSGAACAIAKAAEIASAQQGHYSEAVTLYLRGSDLWALAGEVQKHGDFVLRAAIEASKGGDPAAAPPLYRRAAKLLLPPDAVNSPGRLRSLHPTVGESLRTIFTYFLGRDDPALLPDLISLARGMLALYEAQEMEASACKMRSVSVLLQLEAGDVVAADKLFVEYLGVNAYLKSIDCRITEEYLIAFKFHDHDRLEAAVKSPDNYVFDREVQALCKRLTFMRSSKGKDKGPGGTAVSPPPTADSAASNAAGAASKQALFGKKLPTSTSASPAPASVSAMSAPAAAAEAEEAVGDGDAAAAELAALDIGGGGGGRGDGGATAAATAAAPSAQEEQQQQAEAEHAAAMPDEDADDEDEIDLT